MGMDLVEYQMRIEDEFKIQIDEGAMSKLLTIGQMHDYLVKRLPCVNPQMIWERQLDVLCRFQCLAPEERRDLKPTDHFIRDLKFD